MGWFLENSKNTVVGTMGVVVLVGLIMFVFGGQIGLMAFFFALGWTFYLVGVFLADSVKRQGLGSGFGYWEMGLILAILSFLVTGFLFLRLLLGLPRVAAFLEFWNYLIH